MANTARLVIDPIARKISTKYEKIRLVQNDNNSTRVTFEMPRYVRGHDMSKCSTVEVHYDNISIDRKQVNSDVYFVSDIIVAPEDDETINFSWLVDRNATQIVGNVDFSLHFGCDEDPSLEYAWHTTTYSGIVVLAGKHNTESAVDRTPSIFESFKNIVNERISEATNIIAEVKEIVDNINDQIYGDGDLPEDAQSGSLAYRVSELEKGKLDKSSIAQTLDGFTEEEAKSKAPSVKAVNDGLAGKVNASGKGISLTTAYGRDEKDNQIHIGVSAKASSATANRTVVVPRFVSTNDVSGDFLDSKNPATVNVCLPKKSYNSVPKIYADGMHLSITMDEAFKLTVTLLNNDDEAISTQEIDLPLEEMIVSGKVSDDGEKIILTLKNGETIEFGVSTLVGGLATKEELAEKQDKLPRNEKYATLRTVYGKNTSGEVVEIAASAGNWAYHIASYISPETVGSDAGGTLAVTTPKHPLHSANKQYVDNIAADISSQLGDYIKTDIRYGDRAYGGYPVPDNAYPTVYLSDPSFTAINADGETVYVGRATKLLFHGYNGDVLGYEDIADYTNPSCFVTLPEGTKTIALNIEELTAGVWDSTTLHYWGEAIFQVKGGV